MKEQKITDQMLHDAAAMLWHKKVAEEEANLEPHEFSPEFEAKMQALLRGDKTQENKEQETKGRKVKSLRSHRRFWVTAAMIVIALFTWLAFDAKARAAVADWFESVIEGVFHYGFNGSAVGEEFPTYRLGWYPEGGWVEEENVIPERMYDVFINYEGKDAVTLTYGKYDSGTVFGIDPLGQEMTKTIIKVKGQEIEEYYTPHTDDYNYVWMNEEEHLYFMIWSTFDHETNIRIIKDVLKKK
jgi:hypothetical protein